MFFLKCCQKSDCPHPLCCQQSNLEEQTWFPGGPPLSYIPIPIPDPARPWGSTNCTQCKGVCHGHFLSPQEAVGSTLPRMINPPSQLIKEAFNALKGQAPSDIFLQQVASRCLLPTDEVHIWFIHLADVQKNRKRGAEKATATRRLKKQQAAAQQVAAQQVAAQQVAAQQISRSSRGAQQAPGVHQTDPVTEQQGAELWMDPGSAAQEKSPGSAAQEKGPGSAAQEKGPGSAAQEKGPGSAAQEKGPGSAAQEKGPGSAAQEKGPGSAAQEKGPGSAAQEACCCGACGDIYEEETDEVEEWIACDNCETWFHFACVQINPVHVPEQFFCLECL